MQRIMTVDEVAAQLRKSKYTIRNWIKRGLLPASRVGRSYMIAEEAVMDILQPARPKKIPFAESKRLMEKLLEESRAAGLGEETYRASKRRLEAIEEEMRREAKGEGRWR